ncbi:unnamed protein product [Trichobilharzia regenti]|nr:unnamed protein product [Trichobilharzia regenti]
MDYSFYHWHHRHPWSYTAADKEAINLMRHVSLCLHFIAMILIHYVPNSKALPNIRPLRRQLTSGITQVVNETFNELIQDHTANLSTVIPNIQDLITTNNNNNSSGNMGDGQSNNNIANEMKKRLSPELRQRFFRQDMQQGESCECCGGRSQYDRIPLANLLHAINAMPVNDDVNDMAQWDTTTILPSMT